MMAIFLAQVVNVWLVFIPGDGTLYPSEFMEKVEPQIVGAFLEAGVIVNFQRHLVYLNNFPPPSLNNVLGYHRKIGRLARKLHLLRRNRIVHFVVPRTPEGYMVGVAHRNCYRRNRLSYSYATAQEFNIFGQERLQHSALGAIHELGHGMNAAHVPSASIMNTKVLHLYNQLGALPWDQRSTKEVRKCAYQGGKQ